MKYRESFWHIPRMKLGWRSLQRFFGYHKGLTSYLLNDPTNNHSILILQHQGLKTPTYKKSKYTTFVLSFRGLRHQQSWMSIISCINYVALIDGLVLPSFFSKSWYKKEKKTQHMIIIQRNPNPCQPKKILQPSYP